MKNIYLLLFFLLYFSVTSNLLAANVKSRQAGAWDDSNTWQGNQVPGFSDDVSVLHALTSVGDITIKSIAFSSTYHPLRGDGHLTVTSGTFTVSEGPVFFANDGNVHSVVIAPDATFTTLGDVEFSSIAEITVNGTLNARNLNVSGGGSNFIVGSGGLVNFSGSVDIGNGPHSFTVDGEMTVSGDLTLSGDNSFEVPGSLRVTESIFLEGSGRLHGTGEIYAESCFSSGAYPCPNINPLPVNLLYFQARTQAQGVEIKWASSKTWDFSHYELERSNDGRNFSFLASIDARENTEWTEEYSYADAKPLNGTSYYRLKAVDIDGSFEYKGIEMVQFFGAATLGVFPNPCTTGALNIRHAHEGAVKVSLHDNSGRTAYAGTLQSSSKRIDVSALQAGMYILMIEGTTVMQKAQIIIQ